MLLDTVRHCPAKKSRSVSVNRCNSIFYLILSAAALHHGKVNTLVIKRVPSGSGRFVARQQKALQLALMITVTVSNHQETVSLCII
jgi:hypothetical protein